MTRRTLADLLQGTLDLLILRTLQNAPMHEWAISERIQQISQDVLHVHQGSLYPALSLALAHRALEQFEPARHAAERAIQLNARLAEGYQILATSYYATPGYGCGRRRDPAIAERLVAKALELDPQLGSAHASLIHHLRWMNRLQSALEHANSARALRPNDVVILRARAVALFYLQRPDEARCQVQDVAMLMPRSIMDDWVMAGAEVMAGKRDARQLAAVIERGPVILREIDTARL